MTDGRVTGGRPGWPQALLVGAAIVAVVMGAVLVTGLLPAEIQRIVYGTPLAIFVLIAGTGWMLWRISRRAPGPPDG